jgi:hypothetical protein
METGLYSLQEWRDIWLIIYCALGALLFITATIVAAGTGWLTWRTIGKAQSIVINLAPAVDNVRDTTATMKGTVTFVADSTVKPIVRAYGTYYGARRFLSVLARFTRPKAGA